MMENLRAAANHVALKIILALIIISFVFTGVSGYMFGSSGRYVAKVNGEEISVENVDRSFRNKRIQLSDQLGQARVDELLANPEEVKQLRKEVLSELINQELFRQYVDELKLSVTKTQIVDSIRATPFFQNDNGFDNDRYLNFVRQQGLSTEKYAQIVHSQLVLNQLNHIFSQTDFVLPNEAEDFAKSYFQQRTVRLANWDLKSLEAQQTVSDDEINQFYTTNNKFFITPERMKVEYLMVDAVESQKGVTVDEAEVANYYEQNKQLYGQPNRYDLAAIKVKTEADANAVINDVNAGANFADIVKERSTDAGLKRIGGQLGLIDENALTPEIAKAGLKEKGQLSTPVKTNDGFFVFYLNEFKEGGVRALADIKDRVKKDALLEKAKLNYFQTQQKIGDVIHNDKTSLKSAAQAAGLKLNETDWFSKNTLPEALAIPELENMLFNGGLIPQNGGVGEASEILQVEGDKAYVLRVSAYEPEAAKPLEAVKDQIIEAVKYQKAMEVASQKAKEIVEKLSAGDDAALTAAGLTFAAPITVDLINGNEQAPMAKIFSMAQPKDDKATYDVAVLPNRGLAIVALDKVTAGTTPEGELKDAYFKELNRMREFTNVESLIVSLSQQAKIQIDENYQ